MHLGKGRKITQPKGWEAWLWSAPGWGRLVYDLYRPFKDIETANAVNPFSIVVGRAGSTKTNLAKKLFKEHADAGMGGIILDGKAGEESLEQYAIQYLASIGWPVDKCHILDFFSKFGHPQLDLLYDDRKDHISWYEIVEELTSVTSLLSTARSTPGARELSMARMSWASLSLSGMPAGSIAMFLTDEGFRANVVKKTEHPDLEKFWLGEKAYFKSLPKDVLESLRNKWDAVCLHPAIKPCISSRDTKGVFPQLFDFMQNGGWWIVPLSEDRLKTELRLTIAQIVQYFLKVATMKRQEAKDKPLFLALLDEYPQYKSPVTHMDLLRLARTQNLGLTFLCQDTGIFTDEEFRVLSGCACKVVFSCDRSSSEDMVRQIFQPEGKSSKDWEGKTTYSVRDEVDNYISLVMSQGRGEAICRIDPDKSAYFLEVPHIQNPDINPLVEREFREAVAKRWYRPLSTKGV
jgi:hypothetical protein